MLLTAPNNSEAKPSSLNPFKATAVLRKTLEETSAITLVPVTLEPISYARVGVLFKDLSLLARFHDAHITDLTLEGNALRARITPIMADHLSADPRIGGIAPV